MLIMTSSRVFIQVCVIQPDTVICLHCTERLTDHHHGIPNLAVRKSCNGAPVLTSHVAPKPTKLCGVFFITFDNSKQCLRTVLRCNECQRLSHSAQSVDHGMGRLATRLLCCSVWSQITAGALGLSPLLGLARSGNLRVLRQLFAAH